VGTFLGILLCYGVLGPLGSNLSKLVDDEHSFYSRAARCVMMPYQGNVPVVAIEMPGGQFPSMFVRASTEVEKPAARKG